MIAPDLRCPYCDAGNLVDLEDVDICQEEKNHEMECVACEQNFLFRCLTSVSYIPSAAPCLNEDPHSWERFQVYPNQIPDARRCRFCDEVEWGIFVHVFQEAAEAEGELS